MPEPYNEIGELLRSHKPDPRPSPGLEARIVRSLRIAEPAASGRIWYWFLLPPAVAAGIVLMWPQPLPLPARGQQNSAPSTAPWAAGILDQNPLELETQALQNDARRARHFLMDCLPGLTAPVK